MHEKASGFTNSFTENHDRTWTTQTSREGVVSLMQSKEITCFLLFVCCASIPLYRASGFWVFFRYLLCYISLQEIHILWQMHDSWLNLHVLPNLLIGHGFKEEEVIRLLRHSRGLTELRQQTSGVMMLPDKLIRKDDLLILTWLCLQRGGHNERKSEPSQGKLLHECLMTVDGVLMRN